MAAIAPVSPGEMLREEFFKPLGLIPDRLARHIDGSHEDDREGVMQCAGQSIDKPMDRFKVRAHYKGKPEYEGPPFADRALVRTRRHGGLVCDAVYGLHLPPR